jgi:SAM-dependent methyltransferase
MPARVLRDFAHLLPIQGTALDLACGLGANALFLAQRGLSVWAWDVSPVAIRRLGGEAAARGLEVSARVRDLLAHPPRPESFDVIVVSRFLDRGLCPLIVDALRPGGLLFYQTFVRDKVGDGGPGNPVYRLDCNELLHLFSPLRLRVYREEGRIGDLREGFRDEAMLVGEKSA